MLQRRLVQLWFKLASAKEPPAIDRFLARELGRLDGLPRRDRLWLGDIITDGLRFGALTLFAESWRRDGWRDGATVVDRLAEHPLPHTAEMWRRLRRLPAPVVFFWTFMRKRLTGGDLPPIAPPGVQATEVWRALREQSPTSPAPELRALWAGLPPDLMPLLNERSAASAWRPEQTLHFLDQHALRPPVWLRMLQPEIRPVLFKELAADRFTGEAVGLAVRVQGERGVFELPAYRTGAVEIQDLASQRIGDAVEVRPGDLVWDCCAGAGGKSIQLAALMQGLGTVVATDLHERKLQDLRRRASRTGLAMIKAQVWDGESVPDFGSAVRQNGGFDRVLVDAPCSGSGTWRRNVDGRLRFDPQAPNIWAPVQAYLLDLAAPTVRPGGRLVYATCSWLTAENEAVCDAFMATHPGWHCERKVLAGNPAEDCDTTFHAVLSRLPAK